MVNGAVRLRDALMSHYKGSALTVSSSVASRRCVSYVYLFYLIPFFPGNSRVPSVDSVPRHCPTFSQRRKISYFFNVVFRSPVRFTPGCVAVVLILTTASRLTWLNLSVWLLHKHTNTLIVRICRHLPTHAIVRRPLLKRIDVPFAEVCS